LHLRLNVREHDYVATLAGDAGIKISVHDQSEPPLPNELGLAVPPGNNILISLRRRVVNDKTGLNCRYARDIDDWNYLVNEFNYSSAACIEDSFFTRLNDRCRCNFRNFSGPIQDDFRADLCNYVQICCIFDEFSRPVIEPCVPACFRTEFPISSVSYSRFPAAYLTSLESNLTHDNSASANIFYESMSVETQETEFTYGPEEFLAEVGGQLGLFIGVSVIYPFEFIMFVMEATIYCMPGKYKRGKRNEGVELTKI
jgi:acid-sensing ion channel 2